MRRIGRRSSSSAVTTSSRRDSTNRRIAAALRTRAPRLTSGRASGYTAVRMSVAILLVNLGSPDSPSVPDVRRYLNQFLMDKRVIDVAWPLRRLIVAMVLINRPKQSGHAYEQIWTSDGSPLVVTSRAVQTLLQARLDVPVELAMRYQNPSIERAVSSLKAKGATDVLVIPMFPHYASSSYE